MGLACPLIYVYIYIYIYKSVFSHVCMYVCLSLSLYIYIYIRIYMYIYIYITQTFHMYVCMYVCMSPSVSHTLSLSLYIYVCMYVCFQLVAFVRELMWQRFFLMGVLNDSWTHSRFQYNLYRFILETRVSSSLIEYPIKKALCHVSSLTKATSWKHTYI